MVSWVSNFKHIAIIALFAVAFFAYIWNELREDHDHEKFFTDVRQFMKAGGRNTAKEGYDLCIRLNNFESRYQHHHGERFKPASCEDIYGINPEKKEVIGDD